MKNDAKKTVPMRREIHPLDLQTNSQWSLLKKSSYHGMKRQKSVSTSHSNTRSRPGSHPKSPPHPELSTPFTHTPGRKHNYVLLQRSQYTHPSVPLFWGTPAWCALPSRCNHPLSVPAQCHLAHVLHQCIEVTAGLASSPFPRYPPLSHLHQQNLHTSWFLNILHTLYRRTPLLM